MAPGRSSFASRNMMLKKMENNVGARMHPCLMPLEMGKLSDRDPSCFTWPCWPSWIWWRMVRNFGGQPRRTRIFHGLSQLTVSKALVRSTKAAYSPMFCSLHFSCICFSTKIISMILCWTWTHTGFLACFHVLLSGWAYSARHKARFCLQWRAEWCLNSLNSLIFLPCFCTDRQWLHPWGPAVESLSPNNWWTDPGVYWAQLLPHADRLLLECHWCQVTWFKTKFYSK